MADTYTLHIAGLTRELPICKVNDHLDIAAFIMFSDVELTEACAAALLKKAPEFDVILTAEAKGIPLAYEMARQSGKYWIPARKGPKLYMREPVIIEDESITTAGKQKLVIDKKDIEYMDGKRILIVDDVISTGGSLHALETLAAKSTGTVGSVSVLPGLSLLRPICRRWSVCPRRHFWHCWHFGKGAGMQGFLCWGRCADWHGLHCLRLSLYSPAGRWRGRQSPVQLWWRQTQRLPTVIAACAAHCG